MTLTPKQRANLRAQIQPLIADEVRSACEAAIQQHLKHTPATPSYTDQILAGSRGTPPTTRRGQLPKGAKVFARLGLATALGRGDSMATREAARTLEIEDEYQKAQSAGSAEGGGLLIADDLADDIIELLRPVSVVRRIGAREIEIPRGSKRTPKISVGVASGYSGENQAIPASDLQLGQVVLLARKLATLVVLSNELAQFGTDADIDTVIVDDMLASIGQTEDDKFLRGEGTEHEPKGIVNWADAANKFDANATVNVANTVADLTTAMNNLTNADVPMRRPVWIWAPRTSNFLRTLLNADGQFVFRSEIDQGRLFGWPIHETNNIPINLGAGNDESLIIATDASEVMLGDVRQVSIDRSDQATVTLDGTLTSLFETDRAAVRVRQWNDLALRHAVSASVIEAVTWGA